MSNSHKVILEKEKEKIEKLLDAYKNELRFETDTHILDPDVEADEAEEFATYSAVRAILEKRLKSIEKELG